MIFGDGMGSPATVKSAEWIKPACDAPWGTVGALMPNRYPRILRLRAPDPSVTDWWLAYRALFEFVAAVGERHTSTPGRAWFAVWEGHGFDGGTNSIAWPTPAIDEDTIRRRKVEQARLDDETTRRYAAIRAALDEVPRFHVPNRAYYLVEGAVSAVSHLRYPDSPNEWRNPDLFWPDDRRWFAATDVDFWSVYVGGDEEHLAELGTNSPTPTEYVTLGQALEIEN